MSQFMFSAFAAIEISLTSAFVFSKYFSSKKAPLSITELKLILIKDIAAQKLILAKHVSTTDEEKELVSKCQKRWIALFCSIETNDCSSYSDIEKFRKKNIFIILQTSLN